MSALLTVVSAVGAGIVAGLFLAFSTAVMKALKDLPSWTAWNHVRTVAAAAGALLLTIALSAAGS